MLNALKLKVKIYAREGSFLFRLLSLAASVIESENKIFALKEVFLFPLYGQTYLDKKYYEYLKRLSTFLRHQEIDLIDIGANRGWFVRLAPRFFQVRNIYAYEPALLNMPYLEALKPRFPQLIIRNILLGAKKETKSFYRYGTDGLSSTRKLSDSISLPRNFDTNLREILNMESVSLCADLKVIDAPRTLPFLIKIDTQGAELEILNGARELFEGGSVAAVVIELLVQDMYEHQNSWLEILRFFDRYSFKLLDILTCVRQPDGTILEFDAIFVRNAGLDVTNPSA